jgi:methyl-accepting chemotaxis protein
VEGFVEPRQFSNCKLPAKIIFGFLLVLAINAAVGILCLPQPAATPAADSNVIPALRALADLRAAVNTFSQTQVAFVLAHTTPERNRSAKQLGKALQDVHSAQESYASLSQATQVAANTGEMTRDLEQYLAASQEIVNRANANAAPVRLHMRHRRHRKPGSIGRSKSENLAADLLFGPEQTALEKVVLDLQKAAGLYVQRSDEASRADAATAATNRTRMRRGIALSAGLGLFLAMVIAFAVSRPIHRVIAAAHKIANGDLSGDAMVVEGNNEAGELARCLDEIQSGLREMAQAVTRCGRMAAATETISLAAAQEAESAELQLQQADRAAAATQKIAATATETLQQSSHAGETAAQMAEAADKGSTMIAAVMARIQAMLSTTSQTSEQIQELEKSGKQIGQLVSLIEDIAEQTKARVLNAGIEAARAPDKNSGSAIAAGEVTRLAERTSRAAKEIGLIIGRLQSGAKNAVQAMNEGKSQSEDAVMVMEQVSGGLRNFLLASQEFGEMLGNITTSSSRQVEASERIAASLQVIVKVCRESAEDREGSANAAREVSAVAAELQNLSNRFLAPQKQNSDTQPASLLDWKVDGAAAAGDLDEATGTNGPASAPHFATRPGVAKIHARLLPESGPEAQPRAPSAACEGWRA